MKRLLIAAAFAAVLFAPVAVTTTSAVAQTCSSTTTGNYTSSTCFGPDGSVSTGSSVRIGSSSYENVNGTDANGNAFGGTGATIRSGNSSWTNWSTWP